MPNQERDPLVAEAVRLLRNGDRAAFATIVHAWQDSLFRIGYRIVGDSAAAEDIRQNVLMMLLTSRVMLPNPDGFDRWIRRCTVNEALHYLRRMNRSSRLLHEYTTRPARHDPDPQETVAHAEEVMLLGGALRQLEPEERALLALRFDEDLTFEEIADVVESPASTVKSRMARLVEKIRVHLGVRFLERQCHAS